jgi:hypothetical protein
MVGYAPWGEGGGLSYAGREEGCEGIITEKGRMSKVKSLQEEGTAVDVARIRQWG